MQINFTLNVSTAVFPPLTQTTLTDTVSKNGVSFTLDQNYQIGQYANGDYFCYAPSGGRVTATTPTCVTDSTTTDVNGVTLADRTRHGMGVNPVRARNPWDSNDEGANAKYDDPDNIDPANTGSPYTFSPGETLVKAISLDTPSPTGRPSVYRYVTLTVVDEIPLEGSFRPPISGDFKNISSEWRLDTIKWDRVPSLDTTNMSDGSIDWAEIDANALETWKSWDLWGNGARNTEPGIFGSVYRAVLGQILGECVQALTTTASQETKTPAMIGMIQLGIDQAAASHFVDTVDTENADTASRWDVGKRAPTVLAATLLPDNAWLLGGLSNLYRWQDTSSFGTIDQDIIDLTDDDTEQGAAEGMIGICEWTTARPESFTGVPESAPFDSLARIPLYGNKFADYRRIAIAAQYLITPAIHLFTGAPSIFDSQGILKYNNRWDEIAIAGWPNVGGIRFNGEPTGNHTTEGAWKVKQSYQNWYREILPLLSNAKQNGVSPERPLPPVLTENGTQIILNEASPYVGFDEPQLRVNLRYVELSGDPLAPVGPWMELLDVSTFIEDGQYLISPTATGGLNENATYAVGISYGNTHGDGPWSVNYRYGEPGSDPWSAGLVDTSTELSASIGTFEAPPELESFYTDDRPTRVLLNGISGLPYPSVSYQWKLDGNNVGTNSPVFEPTPDTDAGKVISVDVTLSNTEGDTTTTITGQALSAGVGPQTYFPKLYTSDESIEIVDPGGAPPLFSDVDQTKFTTAVWMGRSNTSGANFNFNRSDGRSEAVIQPDNVLSVRLKSSSGGDVGRFDSLNVDQSIPAWYLISVDTSNPVVADRVRIYRREETSPYPAKRLEGSYVIPISTGQTFRLARDSYVQRMFAAEVTAVGDYWHREGVALDVGDFFDLSGYPIDIHTIGSPRIRIGGSSMTEGEIQIRANSGFGVDPLPPSGPDAVLEDAGEVIL